MFIPPPLPLYLLFGVWLRFELCVCVRVCVCELGRRRHVLIWSSSMLPLPDLPRPNQRPASQRPRLFTTERNPSQHRIKSYEQTSVTSGNMSATQRVYYSCARETRIFIVFCWLAGRLRRGQARLHTELKTLSPLLCTIDTTATGCG